jgi:hypothetical protein
MKIGKCAPISMLQIEIKMLGVQIQNIFYYKNLYLGPGVVTHTIISATWEAETGGLQFKDSVGKKVKETLFQRTS